MLRAILAVLAMLGLFAWTKPSTAEAANIVTCTLRQAGAEFTGGCDVLCLVNALAIDIDRPRPGASCDAPPRQVPATLKEVAPDKYLGTMEGKFLEDPKRFELLLGEPGVAKTPFGWFSLRSASVSGDALQVAIAAGAQLPPTMDDIPHHPAGQRAAFGARQMEPARRPVLPAGSAGVKPVLRTAACHHRGVGWRALPPASAASGAAGGGSRL